MYSGKKLIIATISVIVTVTVVSSRASGEESAVATYVSGGENHTLVLTQSNSVWSCGENFIRMRNFVDGMCYNI